MTYLHQSARKIAFICIVALALSGLVAAQATSAAADISFVISAEPSTLTAPGKVQLSARIANIGDADISAPILLLDADNKPVPSFFDGGSLYPLKKGEMRTWQTAWNVTQQQLDAGKIAFTLKYDKADATGAVSEVSLPVAAPINAAGANAQFSATRKIVPEVVRSGSEVKVLYELVNNGNVKITDIRVRENNLISDTTQTVASLAPGKNATVTFTKKVGNAGLESSALILYKAEGEKTQQKITVDTVKIPLAKPNLTYTLAVDRNTVNVGETVALTLTLKNEGNISYSGVKITDKKLGEVFTNVEIPAGQTVVKTREVTMTEPAAFKFTLSLQDNTGTAKQEVTNEVKVSAYQEGQMMRLNLQVEADRASISTPSGKVVFTITVTNDSNATAKQISLVHGDTKIAEIAELAPGQKTVISRAFMLSQAGKFRFSAQARDSLDNVVTFNSADIDIAYVPPTPSPTPLDRPTPQPLVTHSPIPADFTDGSLSKTRDTLFIIAIVLGVLFGITLVLFAVSSLMRARALRQSDLAYDHLQLEPKRDFADADTYEKPAPAVSETPVAQQPPAIPAVDVVEEELPHHKYLRPSADIPAAPVAPEVAPAIESTEKIVVPPEDGEGYRLARDSATDPLFSGDQAVESSEETGERRARRSDKHSRPANGDGA